MTLPVTETAAPRPWRRPPRARRRMGVAAFPLPMQPALALVFSRVTRFAMGRAG